MIRPYTLDTDMLQRIRQLVGNLYCGRDDLYQIAEQLTDKELAAICNKLADDLAAKNSHWEQIMLMHGEQPDIQEDLTMVLGAEIMKFLREGQSDKERVNLAQDEESKLAQEYEETIVAVRDPEAQALLKKQKEDVEFGKRVLGQIAKGAEGNKP